jgi:hypothetical protein
VHFFVAECKTRERTNDFSFFSMSIAKNNGTTRDISYEIASSTELRILCEMLFINKQMQIEVLLSFFLWCSDTTRAMSPTFLSFLDHTEQRITVGRTPLDE